MWLKEQKIAAGANMWLQKPIYDYRSQLVTAGAMMWLQEQRCGCRSQNVAAGKLFKSNFSPFCCHFSFLRFTVFGCRFTRNFF